MRYRLGLEQTHSLDASVDRILIWFITLDFIRVTCCLKVSVLSRVIPRNVGVGFTFRTFASMRITGVQFALLGQVENKVDSHFEGFRTSLWDLDQLAILETASCTTSWALALSLFWPPTAISSA